MRIYKKIKIWVMVMALSTTMSFLYAQDLNLAESEKEAEKIATRANDVVHDANELLNDDKFVSAEKEYRRAISQQNSNIAGNYNLGSSYYEKGNYDEALFRLNESIKVAESKREKHLAYHNLGNALMKKEECEKAVEAFKNALRSDPTDDETRYNFALAKDCMEKQKQDQKNDQNDQDQDKDKDKEKNDDESEDKKEQEQNQEQDQKSDNDQNEGENDEKDKGDQKENDKEKNKGEDENNKPQQPKPQQGQLSPQQIKSLLEAMNNQEQKVQEKMNAEKKALGPVKTEKDW